MQYPPPYHDCALARTLGTYVFWALDSSSFVLMPNRMTTEAEARAFIREHLPGTGLVLGPIRTFIPNWDGHNHVVLAVIDPDTRATYGFLAGGYVPKGTVIPPGHGDACVPFDYRVWPTFEVALSAQN